MFNSTTKVITNANAIAATVANKRAGAFVGGTGWESTQTI